MQGDTIVEGREMATDAVIRQFVQFHHGFIPKTGWIAHVKEVHGIPTLRGANRARRDRDIEPCPPERHEAIEEALRHFGLIWRRPPPSTSDARSVCALPVVAPGAGRDEL